MPAQDWGLQERDSMMAGEPKLQGKYDEPCPRKCASCPDGDGPLDHHWIAVGIAPDTPTDVLSASEREMRDAGIDVAYACMHCEAWIEALPPEYDDEE